MNADLPPGHVPLLDRLNRHLEALYHADWTDPAGPIRLNADLSLAEVSHCSHFSNARVLLNALAESDGAATTATGNLTREFVKRVWDQLAIAKMVRESMVRVCKVMNELDVWALHLVRVLAELDRLVVKRRKRFVLTKEGRQLLPDHQAGPLFRRLFVTYFRKMDLRYVANLRDVPEIQHTIAIALWRLDEVARHWRPVKGMVPAILPPRVVERVRAALVSPYDTEEWILSSYLLTPLFEFGLIERQRPSEWTLIEEGDSIRTSPLFRRFIAFAPFAAGATSPPGPDAFAA